MQDLQQTLKKLQEMRNDMENEVVNSLNREQMIAKHTRKMEKLEGQIDLLENTVTEIESKLDGDLSDATRERVETMLDRVTDTIDDLQGEIDNLQAEIDDIEDAYENAVDEDILRELAGLPGMDLSDIPNPESSDVIDVEVFREYQQKYASGAEEARAKRRNYKKQSRYNVNFCDGATIDSFCCAYNRNELPENLIDSDPKLKTKWCAGQRHMVEIASQPHWVIIDLKEAQTFNHVTIKKASTGRHWWDRGRREMDMSAWRIEVSDDKENWTEFNRETADTSDVYEGGFEPQKGRYVRLLIDAGEANPNKKAAHARVCEFKLKLINENGEKDVTKAAAIDACSHQKNGEEARNILNDNPAHKWCATDNHVTRQILPHWVIIDFGAGKTFNQLRMVKASGGGEPKKLDMSAWRFEVSDDKENWTEFNREINDQTDIYIKTFPEQTGRYVRLLVDAAEADPNNKQGAVRIYDLRIELAGEDPTDNAVTFDDIIAIAPYAKKETIDKLADKLAKSEVGNYNKIEAVAKFLSPGATERFIQEAFERDDFSAVLALAPYVSKDVVAKIAMGLDFATEMDKAQALMPFLSKEAIAGILVGGDQLNMANLRMLAPLLGSQLIDELLQKLWE